MSEFAYPIYFLILPLPFLIRAILSPAKSGRDKAIEIPFYEDLQKISASRKYFSSNGKFRFSLLIIWVIWGLLICAAARPRWVGEPMPIETTGRDLMIALDLSGSMQMEDFKVDGNAVNRLQIVKKLAKSFVEKRKGDRLGLILFGSRAYLQVPLTLDIKTVKSVLDEADIGLAGKQTAIGDAIGLAMKNLRNRKGKDKVLILLTDGSNNAGELNVMQSAGLAKDLGVKIYTIGIGAKAFRARTFFGTVVKNPSKDLDEKTLMQVASQTGGKYFRASDSEGFEKIYDDINRLEPAKGGDVFVRPIKELFYVPLAFALLLSFITAIAKVMFPAGFKKIKGVKNV
jgi:Ca-activated chloride channel family protein